MWVAPAASLWHTAAKSSMSRAAFFSSFFRVTSVSLAVVASTVTACSSTPGTSVVSLEAGAGDRGNGGPSAVTDGDDAGAPIDSGKANGDVAPTPILQTISPTFGSVGALGPTLVVSGASFTEASIVRVDGTELTTTYFSSAELRAPLPNSKLLTATTLHISVKTPSPGGGTSQDLPFEVRNPVPALSALDPSSALAGSGDTPLTIIGTSFEDHAAVYFDGSLLPGGELTPTSITTTIPASLLKAAGGHNVSIVNGAPGGGTSSSLSFTVTNPSVAIASVSPATALVGDAAKTLTVTGSGFVGASSLAFNGTTLASSFVDSTHLSATLPATSLTNAGTFSVVASNPAPGGGVSSPFSFQVQNPAPSITTLSPNTVYYGATNTTVTVTGTGFVPSSVVKIGSSTLTTTYVTSTTLTAVVPASAFSSGTSVSLTVVSPAPGGGTSNASPISITCDATNVDIPLGPAGTLTTKSTFYSGYVDHVVSAACPLTTLADSSHQEPVDSFVVQNTTSSPIVLSAWAVCSASGSVQSDAYLAFYRGGTVPGDDAARMQCAAGTVVSEGALGSAGNYTSPDANGSNWCPGLTKANGSGLTLAACEKAVVQITAYSTGSGTNYPAPTQIRFKPEAP